MQLAWIGLIGIGGTAVAAVLGGCSSSSTTIFIPISRPLALAVTDVGLVSFGLEGFLLTRGASVILAISTGTWSALSDSAWPTWPSPQADRYRFRSGPVRGCFVSPGCVPGPLLVLANTDPTKQRIAEAFALGNVDGHPTHTWITRSRPRRCSLSSRRRSA